MFVGIIDIYNTINKFVAYVVDYIMITQFMLPLEDVMLQSEN